MCALCTSASRSWLQALCCVSEAAQGATRPDAPVGVGEALLDEAAAPLLGYLSSLVLRVRH